MKSKSAYENISGASFPMGEWKNSNSGCFYTPIDKKDSIKEYPEEGMVRFRVPNVEDAYLVADVSNPTSRKHERILEANKRIKQWVSEF